MIGLVCSIFALVFGFCAGSMRALEKPEVKRLTKLYWDTVRELDEQTEVNKETNTELVRVKLELAKLKKSSFVRES